METRLSFTEILTNKTTQSSFLQLFVDFAKATASETPLLLDWHADQLLLGSEILPAPAGNKFGEADLAIFHSIQNLPASLSPDEWILSATDTDLVPIGLPAFIKRKALSRKPFNWHLMYSNRVYSFEVSIQDLSVQNQNEE